jgi:molybdopterin/thiamine biosynthesis adenylyltransferase
MSLFNDDERARYARHIALKEIGGAGQQRLKRARVALVGAGGLGAPAALYLAAAGIGRLRMIDDDVVSPSNLQRQVLYRTDDVDALKVERAAAHLSALNPHCEIETRVERLDAGNAIALLRGCDVILDGSDSFATRFVVNDAALQMKAPLVSGAVGRWDGQVGVFDRARHADAPCYRCFVPEAPPDADACNVLGIVGALTGLVGSVMALEAIKLIVGAGRPLTGRLLLIDGLTMTTRTVTLSRDPDCPACKENERS